MPYERENIQRLHAYVPGEQPGYRQTAADQDGSPGVVKLNTNENPYPPSDKVMAAIASLTPEALRLYPPADAAEFRQAAADVHNLTPANIIATNGGDELLRLLITVFCTPGNPAPPGNIPAPETSPRGSGTSVPVSITNNPASPPPTPGRVPQETPQETSEGGGGRGIGMTSPSYTLYQVLADIHDTPVTIIERPADGEGGFSLPSDYADQLNAAGCQLAFLVNPHAPTGRLESLDTLRRLARDFRGVLVIDEAYADFAPHNALPLLDEGFENVVILRSLSKGYSLAGLRFGYGLACPAIIAALDKARDSYNTDILAQVAATAAIRDQTYARSTWDRVIAERTRLAAALRGRGFVVPDSHANFLLAGIVDDDPAARAKAVYQYLKAHNLLIRYFDKPPLADRLRITVGTPAQNDRLLELLDSTPS